MTMVSRRVARAAATPVWGLRAPASRQSRACVLAAHHMIETKTAMPSSAEARRQTSDKLSFKLHLPRPFDPRARTMQVGINRLSDANRCRLTAAHDLRTLA